MAGAMPQDKVRGGLDLTGPCRADPLHRTVLTLPHTHITTPRHRCHA